MIAGLAAEGITVVDDIVYIQRGYECFEEKLRALERRLRECLRRRRYRSLNLELDDMKKESGRLSFLIWGLLKATRE